MGLMENEKTTADFSEDGDAVGLELTTSLPEGATVNAEGVPCYLGYTGTKLIAAITFVSPPSLLARELTVLRSQCHCHHWVLCVPSPVLRVRAVN